MQSRHSLLAYSLLSVYGLLVFLPLLDMAFLSLKDMMGIASSPLTPPVHPVWSNYVTAWGQGDLGQYLVNSVVVSGASVALIVLLSSMAAYAIARLAFPGNQGVYLLFLAGLALPIQILAVPLFILMHNLHLIDNLLSVILIYSASGLSFSIFLLVVFIRSIPTALDESAYIDGAGHFQVYRHIILPLLGPAVSVVAILSFLNTWNGFFFPLILLTNPGHMTVAVGVLSFAGQFGTAWNLLLPALVIVMLPTIVVFAISSRWFVRSLTAGALTAT